MDNGTDEQNQLVDAYIKLMGIGYTIKSIRVHETEEILYWRTDFKNLSKDFHTFNYRSKIDATISAEKFIRNWVINHVLNKTTTKGE